MKNQNEDKNPKHDPTQLENICKRIYNCYDADINSPDIYSQLYQNPDNIDYFSADTLSDMGAFSSAIPIPKIILPHYAAAKFKATFGCLPQIDRFYCTIDNKLFLWSIGNQKMEQNIEQAPIITCVSLCYYDYALKRFDPETEYTLVVATPKFIRIYKVTEPITFTQFFHIDINYAPSCITPNIDGSILVGADNGRVFLIKYNEQLGYFKSVSIGHTYSPINFKNGIFPRLLSWMTGYSSPSIIQIVLDTSNTYFTAIDDQFHLRFYNLKANSCTLLNYYDPENHEVISVSPVLYPEVEKPRFVAFCKDGTRLFIELDPSFQNILSGPTFGVRSKKKPPPDLGKDELVCAQTTMGLTVMVGKKRTVMLRGQRITNSENQKSLCEFVTSCELEGASSIGLANFDNQLIDPLIWQHFREPPIVYILTSKGGYKYTFATPSEQLSRMIIASKGFINQEIEECFGNFSEVHEPSSSVILSSFLHPEYDAYNIYFITKYSLEHSEGESMIVKGIFWRITRILEPLWPFTFFESYESQNSLKKWRVGLEFSDVSPILIKQLEHLKGWMAKYVESWKINAGKISYENSLLFYQEKEYFQLFSSLIDYIIQSLAFLSILGHQKKQLITELFKIYEKEADKSRYFECLQDIFGDCIVKLVEKEPEEAGDQISYEKVCNFPLFLETLKDFAKELFTKVEQKDQLDALGYQIADVCPYFSQISNDRYQVMEAVNRLDLLFYSELPHEEIKVFFQSIANPLIGYPAIVSIKDLNLAVSKFVSLGGIKFAIQIIEAKAKFIDPAERAIQFYRSGNKDDKVGSQTYMEISDFLHQPLTIIMHSKNGLEALLKSKLEIIHVFVFYELLESAPEKLLYLDSPFIFDFISRYQKENLWKYYAAHDDKVNAYKEIKNFYAIKREERNLYSEEDLNERVQKLQIALHFARNSNAPEEDIEEINQCIKNITEDEIEEIKEIHRNEKNYHNEDVIIEEEEEEPD